MGKQYAVIFNESLKRYWNDRYRSWAATPEEAVQYSEPYAAHAEARKLIQDDGTLQLKIVLLETVVREVTRDDPLRL